MELKSSMSWDLVGSVEGTTGITFRSFTSTEDVLACPPLLLLSYGMDMDEHFGTLFNSTSHSPSCMSRSHFLYPIST